LALLVIAFALLSLPALARDNNAFPNDVAPPPPEPNPLVVEVPRGGPVWITLSAYSITSPIIRYRIRRRPQAGKLGIPQLVTADTGRVKYTPPQGYGPGEDSFSYQIQSEGGVSAAAEVQIKITDTDPKLITPADLDFGQVIPGESARRVLVVQNIGGGLAEGAVRVPDPWSVEGDPAYRLTAGAKQSFTIVFKPAEQRDYTGDVEYTSDLDRATDLSGKEVAPVAVAPGPVELLPAGGVRMGTIHLENRTDKPRTLRVTPGPSLKSDATVDVPPNGVAEILVQTLPGQNGDIRDVVTVEAADMKTEVTVHAALVQPTQRPQSAPSSKSPADTPPRTPPVVASVAPIQPFAPAPEAPMPDTALPPVSSDFENSAPSSSITTVAGLGLVVVAPDAVRLQCNFKGVAAGRSYRLESKTVDLDSKGRPEAKWVPSSNATVVVNGQTVTADFTHLRPGALYVVRMVAVDPQGAIVGISSTGQIWTPPPKGPPWRWIIFGAILLVGAAAWKWRKNLGFLR
jgi:hypothetical protein